jgi:hypothetical protein
VAESADQAAAEVVRAALPGVLEALVKGAKIPGSGGAADRAMLFRLIRHSASTARERGASDRTSLPTALGAALLETAQARRDAAARRVIDGTSEPVGRDGVTLPAPIVRETR